MISLLWLSAALAQTSSSPGPDTPELYPTKSYESDWGAPFSAAPSILHWRFGVDLADFSGTMQEALRYAAAVPVANYVGNGMQLLSFDIPRPLGPELFAGELRAARRTDADVVAYRVAAAPTEESAARRLFDFAKSMRIEVLMFEKFPPQIPLLEALAEQYGLKIALCGAYQLMLETVHRSGPRVGACLNTARLRREGISAHQVVADFQGRILIVELQDWVRGDEATFDKAAFLREMYTQGVKPALFVLRQAAAAGGNPAPELQRAARNVNSLLQPLVIDLAAQFSRKFRPVLSDGTPEQHDLPESYFTQLVAGNLAATPEGRAVVDAALPRRAIVKPRKQRKLLVLDLNIGHPQHPSALTHDYGLQQLGARTGAYIAVFDNNLDNLKYPKIKDYDAVFLNSTVGLIYSDPLVREGLLRFVREGGGLGGDHGTSAASSDWPEFAKLLGASTGGGYRACENVWLKLDDPQSPLNAGFGGHELLYRDEYYRFTAPYSRSKLHILLSIDVGRTDMAQSPEAADIKVNVGRADSDYGISWIREYGRGRVFYTVLGHNPTLFSTPALAYHLLAAIQYILGDLPADATPSRKIKERAGK